MDVLSLGEVATDVVYFVAGSRQVPGAMITASHNPRNTTGSSCAERVPFRSVPTQGCRGSPSRRTGPSRAADPGQVEPFDPTPGYVNHLFSLVEPRDQPAAGGRRRRERDGRGRASPSIREDARRVDPPLPRAGRELPRTHSVPRIWWTSATIAEQGADLGVAFDGDADHAFFIDDNGSPLSGSATTALIARWFLKREPGARIIHNLITSRAVGETVRAHGGEPIRTRVGHSFIKQVMAETGAAFGGSTRATTTSATTSGRIRGSWRCWCCSP